VEVLSKTVKDSTVCALFDNIPVSLAESQCLKYIAEHAEKW